MEIYVIRNGERFGPFSPEDAQTQIDDGGLSAADSAWAAGLNEWKPLRDVLLSTSGGAPENKSPQKRKRIGRIRGTLRRIRDFVDRQLTKRTVVAVTILLLVATWIYPPWIHYGRYQRVTPEASHGWFFVFDTQQREGNDSQIIMRIDLGRLLLIDSIILAAGGLIGWAIFRDSTARRAAVRIASFTLVVAPFAAAIVCWESF